MYKQANYCATTPSIMPLDSEYSRYHAHTSSSGIDRSTDIHEKHLQVTTVELPADSLIYLGRVGDEVGHRYTITHSIVDCLHLKSSQMLIL